MENAISLLSDVNWIDIIVIILLATALFRGLKSGLVIQATSLIGFIIAIYVAKNYATEVGELCRITSEYVTVIGFVIAFLLVNIAFIIVGKIVSMVVSIAGLGIFDKLFGSIFSMLQTLIVLGVVFWTFNTINQKTNLIDTASLNKSYFYNPIVNMASSIIDHKEDIEDSLNSIKIPNIISSAKHDGE